MGKEPLITDDFPVPVKRITVTKPRISDEITLATQYGCCVGTIVMCFILVASTISAVFSCIFCCCCCKKKKKEPKKEVKAELPVDHMESVETPSEVFEPALFQKQMSELADANFRAAKAASRRGKRI